MSKIKGYTLLWWGTDEHRCKIAEEMDGWLRLGWTPWGSPFACDDMVHQAIVWEGAGAAKWPKGQDPGVESNVGVADGDRCTACGTRHTGPGLRAQEGVVFWTCQSCGHQMVNVAEGCPSGFRDPKYFEEVRKILQTGGESKGPPWPPYTLPYIRMSNFLMERKDDVVSVEELGDEFPTYCEDDIVVLCDDLIRAGVPLSLNVQRREVAVLREEKP